MDVLQAQAVVVFLLAQLITLQELLHMLILFLVLAYRYVQSNRTVVVLAIILPFTVLIAVQSATIPRLQLEDVNFVLMAAKIVPDHASAIPAMSQATFLVRISASNNAQLLFPTILALHALLPALITPIL